MRISRLIGMAGLFCLASALGASPLLADIAASTDPDLEAVEVAADELEQALGSTPTDLVGGELGAQIEAIVGNAASNADTDLPQMFGSIEAANGIAISRNVQSQIVDNNLP